MKEGEFKTSKNTFYKGRPITGDTEVNQVYKDIYDGYKATATIGGPVTQGAYIATTDIAPQPYYGAGEMNELYLRFTARNVSGSKIAVPKLSVFKMQDGIAVTPGQQDIDHRLSLSGGAAQIAVFGSTMNMDEPFLVEPFDGVNKGFEDNFFIESLTRRKSEDSVYIKAGKCYNLYSDKGVFEWDGASKGGFKKKVAKWGGTYSTEGITTTRFNPDLGDWKNIDLPLTKNTDGTYSTDGNFLRDSNWRGMITAIGDTVGVSDFDYEEPRWSMDEWFQAGAYAVVGNLYTGGEYQTESMAEDMGKITTKNSIFTSVGGSIQINSPKVASEEDTGNSEIVYMYSDVFFSEPEATDSSCLFSALWENWTPANDTALTENPAGANPLGFSDEWSPFLQETFSSIDGIPSPSWCDMSNSNIKRGEYWPLYPNTVPEIELRLKLSQLLPTAKVSKDATTVLSGSNGEDAFSIARSFNVFLSDRSYKTNRPLLRNMHRAYWPKKLTPPSPGYSTEYGPGAGFHFIKTSSTQEGFYCIPSCVGRVYKGNAGDGESDIKKVIEFTKGWSHLRMDERTVIPIISGGTSRLGELASSGNLVTVPEDEWFTMRIKTPMFRRGIISYFPDLEDDNGDMPWLKCYEYFRRKLNNFDDYTNEPTRTLMMGTFNLRPITAEATGSGSVNMPYMKDDFVPDDEVNLAFQDSQINVYVDDIKLLNYAPKIQNATKVPSNPMAAQGLTVPTPHYNTNFDYLTGSLANFSLSGNLSLIHI